MDRVDERAGRALLLDMDGTLADSLPVLRRVYARFLESLGAEGSDEGFELVNGVPLREVVRRLKLAHGLEPDEHELHRRFVEAIGRAYDDVAPMAGAKELLERAVRLGVPVAIVTSASTDFARGWLARVGLLPLAAHVVGGDAVARGKPDPEPYLQALERLDAVAVRSLAVEDSRIGAAAAVAAGVPTWVLAPRGEHGRIGTDWPAVAGFVTRLADLPLETAEAGGRGERRVPG